MKKLTLLALALAVSIGTAVSAHAASLVAGWDFSQYLSGGHVLSVDGVNLSNTLAANYSSLDPTFPHERDVDGSRAPPLIDRELVGHQFVAGGAPMWVRERPDVDENSLTTAVRRDESEALIILPGG